MGLYLKARNFLDHSELSGEERREGVLGKFLKGKSLIKSISPENKLSDDLIVESSGDTVLNSESEEPKFQNKPRYDLELPIELESFGSIIIYESDEIELDISVSFSDEGVKFIEPKSRLENQTETVEQPEEEESPKYELADEKLDEPSENISDDNYNDAEVKLENYVLLKDLIKELLYSDSIINFFENLMYSIEGQLGSKYIILFSSINELFQEYEIVSLDGIDLESNVLISNETKLIKTLIESAEIVHTNKIDSSDIEQNGKIIGISDNEIILPLKSSGILLGFIILGENDSAIPYTNQEIDFLNILLELSSATLYRFYEQEKIQKQLNELNLIKIKTELLNTFNIQSSYFTSTEQLFSAYKELLNALEIDFPFAIYIQKSKEIYSLSYQNNFDLISNIKSDEIMIKELKNNKKNLTLTDVSEISRVGLGNKSINLRPGFDNDELYCIIITPKEYDIILDTDIVSNSINIIHRQIIRILSDRKLKDLAKNPYALIEELLINELLDAQKKSTFFSLLVVKIQNSSRVIQSLGNEYHKKYSDFMDLTIRNFISSEEETFRLGRSKQCIFLKNRNANSVQESIQILKDKLNDYPDSPKDFKLAIHIYSLDFPEQSMEIRKFMELVEET